MKVKGHKAALAITVAGLTILASVSGAGAAPKPSTDPVAQSLAIAQSYMTAPTKLGQTIPLRVRPTVGQTVIFANSNNANGILIAQGMQQAAAAIGWNFDQVIYDPANPASFQAALLTALQKNPAAVITSGANTASIGASVTEKFALAKIPLVMGASCPLVAVPPIFPAGNQCPSELVQGKILANWFIADSKGKGKLLLQSMPVYPVLVTFKDALIAEVKLRCAGCTVEVLETTPAQLSSNQISSVLVNKLRSDPSLGYLFYDNGAWAKGIVPALDAAGLGGGRIKVGGRGMDEGALGALKAGTEMAWTAIPYVTLGMTYLDSALRIVTKSSGISKNAVSPTQLVTSVNAGPIAMPYMAPSNPLELYKKLWLVKK